MIRLRTRIWFGLAAVVRRVNVFDGGDILTLAALAFVWYGLSLFAPPLAFVVVGFLLVLVTPIGAALRILLRGK
jgi:hypothetical protein